MNRKAIKKLRGRKMGRNEKRVIVIGLDGFTWKTLDYLRGQLKMENLEKLRESSAWGRLESTVPPSTIPAWISFATGCNPGKHAVFDFIMPHGSLRNVKPMSSKDIKADTLQQILRMSGRKSVIINLPGSTPALTEDITVGSFLSDEDHMFSPKGISAIEEVGRYRITEVGEAVQDQKRYLKTLNEGLELRFGAAKRLFGEEWDFFFVLFSETDFMQHAVFDQIKKGRLDRSSGHEVLAVYKRLDECIGWFAANARKDDYIILVSDHGFESYEYVFSLLNFLERHGFLAYQKASEKSGLLDYEKEAPKKKGRMKIDVSPLINLMRGRPLTRKILDFMGKIYFDLASRTPIPRYFEVSGHAMAPDPDKSIAMPLVRYGYSIYINSKARFDVGITGETETEKVRERLIGLLSKERSPLTGESPFTFVKKAEEEYTGPYATDGPDIVIGLHDHAVVGIGHHSKSYSRLVKNYHDNYGIFAISGPGIKNGRLEDRKLIDVAPTILHLLGIPVPSHMDGSVITDVFIEPEMKKIATGESGAMRRLRERIGAIRRMKRPSTSQK
jgi:predicted AlkP superfamily phosphohydrolase/phosphomutase